MFQQCFFGSIWNKWRSQVVRFPILDFLTVFCLFQSRAKIATELLGELNSDHVTGDFVEEVNFLLFNIIYKCPGTYL